MKFEIKSVEEMDSVAQYLLDTYSHVFGSKAVVFALCGALGAGKTTFTKAFGKALGLPTSEITSPTFVLHAPYRTTQGIPIDHLDIWRIEQWSEVERLGVTQMINDHHVLLIEWADLFTEEIKALRSAEVTVVWISITLGEGETERVVTVEEVKG